MISPDLLFYKFKPWKKAFITAIQRIKSKPPKDLDQQFERLHDAVFEKIDCLECANCCKTTSPMFFEKDIDRLSKALGMKTSAFVSEYLVRDKDDIYGLKSTPCPFLGSDNYCSVYDDRPKACREYPHTNRRKMHTHLHLLEKNAIICPAVYEISQKIAKIEPI